MTSRVARAPMQHASPSSNRRLSAAGPSPPSLSMLRARYHVRDRLGAGCAGTVVHAIDKATRVDVAVKIVPKHLLVDNSCRLALAREVSVLSKLKHDHVVHFSNAFEDANHVYIATEFCPRGDLYQYLKKQPSGLPEREALKYLRQVLRALQYLHSHGISHRDVKPENILMTPNGKVKLADFGMCYWRRPGGEKSTRQHCGTPQYAAPEIMRQAAYVPEHADMWACGVMLYAMLTRTLPFVGHDWTDLQNNIVHADPDAISRTAALTRVSDATRHLLKSLLSMHPSHRPVPSQAVELLDDALLGVRRPRSGNFRRN